MRTRSKLLPILLSLVLAVSMCPAPAFAGDVVSLQSAKLTTQATNPYPKWQTIDGKTTVRCTHFAWQQAYDNLGVALPGWSHGYTWYNSARNAGYSVGTSPRANSIAVWSGNTYGHVAFVTAVNGNSMTVNEGGWTGGGGTSEGIRYGGTYSSVAGSRTSWGLTLTGFIYLQSGPVEPTTDVYVTPGAYTISSKAAPGSSLDIVDGSAKSETNLQLWSTNVSVAQRFSLVGGTGGYTLSAFCASDMRLDVEGNSSTPGANVRQYVANDSGAQRWTFRDAGDGYYYIRAANGLYLDLDNGSSADGTNVKVWSFNGSDAQKWRLGVIESTIYHGVYYLSPQCAPKTNLDIAGGSDADCANAQIYHANESTAQMFAITGNSNGYNISALCSSGKRLDVEGNNSAPGTNVRQCVANDTGAQRWRLQETGDGYFYLRADNGLYLDVDDYKSENETNVKGYTFGANSAQKWKLTLAEVTVESGVYTLTAKCAPKQRLDIAGGSGADGANAQLYEINGTKSQMFSISKSDSGYAISPCCSMGKSLDVAGGDSTPGTNVRQYASNNTAAQRWTIMNAGDGYCFIRSGNGLFLDVEGYGTANETNVQAYSFGANDAQRWKLEKQEESSSVSDGTKSSSNGTESTHRSIASAAVSAVSARTYTGKALTQSPTVMVGTATLKAGTDYELSYANNVNAGTATMTITGKGSYTGTKVVSFTIGPAPLSSALVTVENQRHTGEALTPAPVVTVESSTLSQGTDYTVSYKDNTAVGTATVIVTGIGNYTGSKSATFAIVPQDLPQPTESVVMHRLYNPNSGEHFYTSDAGERDGLVGLGWSHEGVGWTAPASSGTPVYRMYNPNAGDHHYTADASERDSLAAAGWKYEGVGWYSDDGRGTALLRLYNPNAPGAGAHHYTTSDSERDMLVRAGWRFEGVGWYGV